MGFRALYDFIWNPAILGPPMKHRSRPPEQDDQLRPRLVDQRHEMVKLAALIDGEVSEGECAGFLSSGKDRPAKELRRVAGLIYL